MPSFSDHFSAVADTYAAYRPHYPDALFKWLASLVVENTLAWDCACGNGQSASGLVRYFDRIVATDASEAQIKKAALNPKIDYRVATAEVSGLQDKSVDLVTVAQALHWLDVEKFNAEVLRVTKKGGVLAAWGLGWAAAEDRMMNAVMQSFQVDILGKYWDPKIGHVGRKYRDMPFPFEEIEAPSFKMEVCWTLEQILGLFRSYSATAAYIKAKGTDPVLKVEKELAALWGDPGTPRVIKWPGFFARVGRIV